MSGFLIIDSLAIYSVGRKGVELVSSFMTDTFFFLVLFLGVQ
jgi:hypothetical protein